MGRRVSAASTIMAVVTALLVLLLVTVPAAAHHKDEHLQGGGNGSAASQADEDGDVADEGDNAHPSGKDRSVENGGSANARPTQGSSESDPDDDGRGPDRSNGGPDKPNGSGGVDKADQDGNNGCGNDDDFEDDNEGWCGGKPKPARPEVQPASAVPCDADATMPGTQPCRDDVGAGAGPTAPCVDLDNMAVDDQEVCEEEVLGGVISRPATAQVEAPPAVDEAEVLGERLAQAQPGGGAAAHRGASFLGKTLPFTGSALLGYGAIAAGLLLAGAGLMATRKRA